MELGRFKTRIENDSWETEVSNNGKQDLLFQNIRIENDKIKGTLKTKETDSESIENYFAIYKKGESFMIKTEFFVNTPEELEIKFNKTDLLIFDKKNNIEISINNKEAYN
jgi:hypothetical protein